MEREGLEARQAPRWSDAEAAENRARRLMTVLEGRWRQPRTLSHSRLLFGRFGYKGFSHP